MSRRRKKQEEHVNLERWLVSYADFITLLFAFFVVMYAISSVNEGKYRILSDTLNEVFQSRPTSNTPIEFDNALENLPTITDEPDFIDIPVPENVKNLTNIETPELDILSEEIAQAVQPLIDDDTINIKKTDYWLEIEIKSGILFGSGNAQLSEDAEDILSSIADQVSKYPNNIQIEGFTDDKPIKTSAFPSNWELSSSRAASVVRLFEQEGIDPRRMQAIGYGQYKPIADNNSAIGRNKNRRINLVILAQGDPRQLRQKQQQESNTNSTTEQTPSSFIDIQ